MRARRWQMRFTGLAQAFVMTSLSTFALGQENLNDTPAPIEEPSESAIEEIIVTAMRREAVVQSVPVSVSVLTAEQLERLGATSFADYARTVPGLSFVDPGFGGEKQTIRGISLNANFYEANPVTALYLDEVPIIGSGGLNPYNGDPMLVDIERIEVLRGPQGTLFGSGAMGGAIRIITGQPDVSRSEGFASASVTTTKGAGQGFEIQGAFNTPIVPDKAAIRAVGYLRDRDGFIDNVGTGEKKVNTNEVTGGRLSGKYHLTDRVHVSGRIAYQERNADGTNFEDLTLPPRHQDSLPESTLDEWTNYNLVIDADLGWGKLKSSTSYLDRSLDETLDVSPWMDVAFGFSNPIWTNMADDVIEKIQEIRLTAKDDAKIYWVVGAFYQDLEQDLFQDLPAPGFDEKTGGLAADAGVPDYLFIADWTYTLTQLALYGDLSYAVSDRLELGVGGRWFDMDRDFTASLQGLFAPDPFASGAIDESGVTPRFSLTYDLTDNITVYTSAAEGYRLGGVNSPEGSNTPECLAELASLGYSEYPSAYKSDSLWNYELGSKARWRNGRFQLNTTIYHIDWSEMQTTQFLDCGVFFFVNAGEADSDGAELEFVAHPTDQFVLNLAAQYNKAELKNDVPGLGGSAGDRVPGVPRFSGSVGVSYYFPAFGSEAFIHGDYAHVGKSYNVFDPDTRRELPAYNLTNLRIGLDNGRWVVTLFVDNVFDERGIVGLDESVIRQSVTATPPRTIGLSTRRSFGDR